MACREIAALRLALMTVLGKVDEAARAHELAELGDEATQEGPLKTLLEAKDLDTTVRLFRHTVTLLDERVSTSPAEARDLGYLRTLAVLARKVELDLDRIVEGLDAFQRDLETIHDAVHEIHSA